MSGRRKKKKRRAPAVKQPRLPSPCPVCDSRGPTGIRCSACGVQLVPVGTDEPGLLRLRGKGKLLAQEGDKARWRQRLLLTLQDGQQLAVETAPESVIIGPLEDGPMELLGEVAERFREPQGLREQASHTRVLRAHHLTLGAESSARMDAIIAQLQGEGTGEAAVSREVVEGLPTGVHAVRGSGPATLTITVGDPFPLRAVVIANVVAGALLTSLLVLIGLSGTSGPAMVALGVGFLLVLLISSRALPRLQTVVEIQGQTLTRRSSPLSLPPRYAVPTDEMACLTPRGEALWLRLKDGKGRLLLKAATRPQMAAVRQLLERAVERPLVGPGGVEERPDPVDPRHPPDDLTVEQRPAGELHIATRWSIMELIRGMALVFLLSLGLLCLIAIALFVGDKPVGASGRLMYYLLTVGPLLALIVVFHVVAFRFSMRTELEADAQRIVVRRGVLRLSERRAVPMEQVSTLLQWEGSLGLLLQDGEIIELLDGGYKTIRYACALLQQTLELSARAGTEAEQPLTGSWLRNRRLWVGVGAAVFLLIGVPVAVPVCPLAFSGVAVDQALPLLNRCPLVTERLGHDVSWAVGRNADRHDEEMVSLTVGGSRGRGRALIHYRRRGPDDLDIDWITLAVGNERIDVKSCRLSR